MNSDFYKLFINNPLEFSTTASGGGGDNDPNKKLLIILLIVIIIFMSIFIFNIYSNLFIKM